MIPKRAIDEFWQWFRANAAAFTSDFENPILLRELDREITKLDPGLSWEIGPGLLRPLQLVISRDFDRDLIDAARSIVAEAADLGDWEFYPARQPKRWNYKFELSSQGNDGPICLDATDWTFVLLQHPVGTREILLKGVELPLLTDEERWRVAAIVLESVLGEDVLLNRVNEFDLVDEFEPSFASKAQPIQRLRAAVVGD